MKRHSSEFIGRKAEFARIEELFQHKGNLKIVGIHGAGGIGKTRLLQEIQLRYQDVGGLFVSTIYDFDDPSFHILRNFRVLLAEQLDSKYFSPYLNALDDFRKMELANVSPERLGAESETIDRIFVSCFNNGFAQKYRPVLLFDTIENVQDEYLWEGYLLKQLAALKNSIVILAGRKLDLIQANLTQTFGNEALDFIELKGFSFDEANEYFNWTRIGKEIPDTLREKIHFLADGKPILIDLAIDWLSWDVPLPDLLDYSLADIKSLEPEKLLELREQFEQALVIEVLSFIKPTDRAILDMACVHRFFNTEILAFLLGLSPVKAKEMMRRLGQFTFVKPRPQNNYVLHDEMRRMVNTYAWPKYDPFGTQKKKTHAKMAEYYRLKTEEIEQQIREKSDILNEVQDAGEKDQELLITQEISAQEREYWLLKIEHLHHSLRSDLKKALKIFIESADKATEEFRYEYRRAIFDEILLFEQNFKATDQYEIYIRQAKYSLDKGQYEEVYQELQRLLQQYADNSGREVDILIQLGNATIRMGKPNETLNFFQRALTICQQKKLKNWLGIVHNELGWTNRILGKWDAAIKHYELALEHTEKAQDTMSLADTLNNLGFVYSLKGDYSSALAYCEQALNIRATLGLTREIGMSHNTLSMVYRNKGEYDTALQHSNLALAIFKAQNDIEWLGKTYRERGVTRWRTVQLEMARQDLEQSVTIFEKYDFKNELPTTYYRLANVLWQLGLREVRKTLPLAKEFFDRAENLLSKSLTLGTNIADIYTTINSLTGMIELLYEVAEVTGVSRVSELRQYYKKLQKLNSQAEILYPLSYGHAERIMGAVEQDTDHFTHALAHYKKGYHLIARHNQFHRFTLDYKAIGFLGKKIGQLQPAIAIRWCEELIRHWRNEKLDTQYPEFINYCKVWRMRASMTFSKPKE
ncbi:tetratricopeptide repeat protein [candidate division KSB1 bacterium]|nr:tetratricopeptide repeat protein [candidate division KSB1 bacterium]